MRHQSRWSWPLCGSELVPTSLCGSEFHRIHHLQDRILTESIITTLYTLDSVTTTVCGSDSQRIHHNHVVWIGFLQKPSPSLYGGVQFLKYKRQHFSLKNWNLRKALCFERLLCTATLFNNDLYMQIVIYFVVFKVHLLLHSWYNRAGHA